MKHTTEEINEFLTLLRDMGSINMWGAVPYLEDRFDMTRNEAKAALFAWMEECRKGANHVN